MHPQFFYSLLIFTLFIGGFLSLLKKVWSFFLRIRTVCFWALCYLLATDSVATQLVRQYKTILVPITVLSRRINLVDQVRPWRPTSNAKSESIIATGNHWNPQSHQEFPKLGPWWKFYHPNEFMRFRGFRIDMNALGRFNAMNHMHVGKFWSSNTGFPFQLESLKPVFLASQKFQDSLVRLQKSSIQLRLLK